MCPSILKPKPSSQVEALEERDVPPKVGCFALQLSNNDLEEAYQITGMLRLDEDDEEGDRSGLGSSSSGKKGIWGG